jgi:hypothetical protein
MSWTRASKPVCRPWLVAAAVVAATSVGARASYAQQTHAGDAALAETLFNDAKRKMAIGDYAGACPKLAESYRLDPGTGTLIALAVCNEGLGKTASAWTEFIQVVSDARQAGRRDREKFAAQHISAIETKLSKLRVVVDGAIAGLPDLEVRRDGSVLGQAGWGTAAPVDPGEHTVEVKATGKKPWSTHVTIGPAGDVQTVAVPILDDVPPPPPPEARSIEPPPAAEAAPAPPDETPSAGNAQRVVGISLGALGIVAAGVGTYFGVRAISKNNQATSACPDANDCTRADAVRSSQDAKSAAQGADVAFAGAAGAAVVGAIVYFTARSSTPPPPGAAVGRLHFVALPSAHGGGVMLDGRW